MVYVQNQKPQHPPPREDKPTRTRNMAFYASPTALKSHQMVLSSASAVPHRELIKAQKKKKKEEEEKKEPESLP